MMLDSKKFKTKEEKSTPTAVAIVYPDCSIDKICFGLATGFATMTDKCKYLKFLDKDGKKAECTYQK